MGRAACRRTLEHLLFATSSRAFTQTARAALRAQAAGTLHRRQLRGRPHRGAVPQELDRDAFVERLQRAADARVRVASRSHLNPPEERTDALERRRTFAWRPVRGAVT
jgi:hypothetical protein